ncbi:MAG: phospholipid transport system substrate-binding protein [Enterobacterales bacterium]|jgi:phospholipid transport system substrate-binding protein
MMQIQHQSPTLPILVWLSKNWNVIHFKAFLKKEAFKVSFIFLIFYGTTVNGCSLYISGDNVPEPVQIVESQTNILLTQLSSRKVEFDNDPQSLVDFAKNIALSHWNLQKTSRLMLGKYWNIADPKQQLRFEDEFMRTLMRYVVKAYGYYDESFVKVISYDWQPRGNGGWVKSVVKLPAGLKVAVDYRMMLDNKKVWKLIDVRVEGISLVGAKKGEYRSIIRSKGMDNLLKSMSNKNGKVLDS